MRLRPKRALEIAALIGRDTDFEELTRRSFGEPCPVPRCKDHRAEVRRKRMAVSKRGNEASRGVQRRGARANYFQTVVIRSQQNQRTSVEALPP
jgi:hypothetical protein